MDDRWAETSRYNDDIQADEKILETIEQIQANRTTYAKRLANQMEMNPNATDTESEERRGKNLNERVQRNSINFCSACMRMDTGNQRKDYLHRIRESKKRGKESKEIQ